MKINIGYHKKGDRNRYPKKEFKELLKKSFSI
jgi:hypothetical protein